MSLWGMLVNLTPIRSDIRYTAWWGFQGLRVRIGVQDLACTVDCIMSTDSLQSTECPKSTDCLKSTDGFGSLQDDAGGVWLRV